MRRIPLVFLLFILTACTAEVVVEPTITAVPTTVPIVMATTTATAVATIPPTPTIEVELEAPTQLPPTVEPSPSTRVVEHPVVVEYGRTPEGAFFHGAADAPVTLIDFSDFL